MDDEQSIPIISVHYFPPHLLVGVLEGKSAFSVYVNAYRNFLFRAQGKKEDITWWSKMIVTPSVSIVHMPFDNTALLEHMAFNNERKATHAPKWWV